MASRKGDTVNAESATYVRYADSSGVELWLLLNKKRELLDINPYFEGESSRRVKLTAAVRREGSEMDGAFHCFALEGETELYPFVFDVPDLHTMGRFSFPSVYGIRLTAFAHDVYCFDDESEFENSQVDRIKFGPKRFIPTGLYSEAGAPTGEKESFASFSGTIERFELKTNTLTGREFYWILVDTSGGGIDVVVDPEMLNKAPRAGGAFYGHSWLSGRIMDPPVPDKPRGFFDKLFGRH